MTIQAVIEEKLQQAFTPLHLEVINESHNHNVATGSESHFKVVIAASAFEGKRLLQRHRTVNGILADELANHIHALALHTYSETEWQANNPDAVPLSPKCMGGSKK
ncbi:MAG: BolA/IbaG family iron-sulfur metabolism protein [Thalassotalea sp.]